MGLRLAEGVDLGRIAALSGVEEAALIDRGAAEKLEALELVHMAGAHLTVTEQGMPLLDALLAELVAIEPPQAL